MFLIDIFLVKKLYSTTKTGGEIFIHNLKRNPLMFFLIFILSCYLYILLYLIYFLCRMLCLTESSKHVIVYKQYMLSWINTDKIEFMKVGHIIKEVYLLRGQYRSL